MSLVGTRGTDVTILINELYRFNSSTEGSLLIDNINIASLGLPDFRRKLSFVSRDPILYFNTIRQNLDPSEECTDSELWTALDRVELKCLISKMPSGLMANINEHLMNSGQRQQLCLAKSILQNNRMLIYEENVDNKWTNQLIQKIIHKEFVNWTVITVGQRLMTVVQSDKVLVMDRTRVVEFGHPFALIQRAGTFKSLIDDTGNDVRLTLIEIAKENYTRAHDGDMGEFMDFMDQRTNGGNWY